MRNKSAFIIGIFVALILITALSTLSKGAETEDIEGIWMGTLKVSVVELRIVFKINANADGTLAATMDSPDQGAENIAGAISEYAKIEETISPIALKAITQWILKQTSQANK